MKVIDKIKEAAQKARDIDPELMTLEIETRGIRIQCYDPESDSTVNYMISWFELEYAKTNTVLRHMDKCLKAIRDNATFRN